MGCDLGFGYGGWDRCSGQLGVYRPVVSGFWEPYGQFSCQKGVPTAGLVRWSRFRPWVCIFNDEIRFRHSLVAHLA